MKETQEYFNQHIDCSVNQCKFHDSNENRCTLGKILIDHKKAKKETFCHSFEEKI